MPNHTTIFHSYPIAIFKPLQLNGSISLCQVNIITLRDPPLAVSRQMGWHVLNDPLSWFSILRTCRLASCKLRMRTLSKVWIYALCKCYANTSIFCLFLASSPPSINIVPQSVLHYPERQRGKCALTDNMNTCFPWSQLHLPQSSSSVGWLIWTQWGKLDSIDWTLN